MTAELLAAIDPYLYRHKTGELMTLDPVFVVGATSLRAAIGVMMDLRISSVLVERSGEFGGPGIVTEHDVLRAISEGGGAALDRVCGEVMSTPLFGVDADDFLHVAIGRMARLGLRHLVVRDGGPDICGIITARGLNRHRAAHALIIGDELRAATTAEDLKAAHDKLVGMAKALLDDHTDASIIASVMAGFYRYLTQRAMELAEAESDADLPRYGMMILGSAGRGESLLAGDQDNAIVFEDGSDDTALAETAQRATDLLDAAGLPYCNGGVMASRPAWRRSLSAWRTTVEHWTRHADGASLLNVDIFFDLVRVYGDRALVDALRHEALEDAAKPLLPRMMAQEVMSYRSPVGFLGNLRLDDGRLDLKLSGLFPLVAGARAMALRHGIEATGTRARLVAVAGLGMMGAGDLEHFCEAHELFLELILRQQITDIDAGRQPGNRIHPDRLDRGTRRDLRKALRDVARLPQLVLDVAAHG